MRGGKHCRTQPIYTRGMPPPRSKARAGKRSSPARPWGVVIDWFSPASGSLSSVNVLPGPVGKRTTPPAVWGRRRFRPGRCGPQHDQNDASSRQGRRRSHCTRGSTNALPASGRRSGAALVASCVVDRNLPGRPSARSVPFRAASPRPLRLDASTGTLAPSVPVLGVIPSSRRCAGLPLHSIIAASHRRHRQRYVALSRSTGVCGDALRADGMRPRTVNSKHVSRLSGIYHKVRPSTSRSSQPI
ncbi:uncharacterized protein C8Q71DRAFT_425134 [Rhodofomes roseus]|uniref:Uncharacterized protein n=1 Tax=Rhodofomes roseus TaxID=34475 RepID=A0ABQ8KR50_9APHY|nr:uncharacterized protein C8Q71DRAFT_425134 [Rhodofomes roseus]KAH9840827.1 hypothetical protein C8Q71DRAFT_425134 [Rhodofomes roseus]